LIEKSWYQVWLIRQGMSAQGGVLVPPQKEDQPSALFSYIQDDGSMPEDPRVMLVVAAHLQARAFSALVASREETPVRVRAVQGRLITGLMDPVTGAVVGTRSSNVLTASVNLYVFVAWLSEPNVRL
jgi:hypothetical protein